MEASRTTSFDEYKVQNTSIILSKELLWKKCGIKLSVQAAIIVIVDLSQLFVRGNNSQYILNLLSLFMYAITK